MGSVLSYRLLRFDFLWRQLHLNAIGAVIGNNVYI